MCGFLANFTSREELSLSETCGSGSFFEIMLELGQTALNVLAIF